MSLANWPLLELVTWRTLSGSLEDDWVGRLSHKTTVSILVMFAAVVTSAQYIGDPIHCWSPAQYKKAWHINYIKRYCWISNTYHVPINDVIPGSADDRMDSELSYYQWVPIILLVQALLFKLPNVLWRMTNRSTGINLTKLCQMVDLTNANTAEDRGENIRNISVYIDRWLRKKRHYHSEFMAEAKRKTFNIFLFCFGQRDGVFLSGLCLFVKLAYLTNCILQFWLLGELLSVDFFQYGVDSLNCIMGDCIRFANSPRFPRVTMCDFQIRQLQNIQPFTVQCVLPINLFNEKIFVFLWLWIIFIGFLTLFSAVSWLKYMVMPGERVRFVRKYLMKDVNSVNDMTLLKKFADQYLRTDGCFLLKIVRNNTSDLTLMEVLTNIWNRYKYCDKEKNDLPCSCETAPTGISSQTFPVTDDCVIDVTNDDIIQAIDTASGETSSMSVANDDDIGVINEDNIKTVYTASEKAIPVTNDDGIGITNDANNHNNETASSEAIPLTNIDVVGETNDANIHNNDKASSEKEDSPQPIVRVTPDARPITRQVAEIYGIPPNVGVISGSVLADSYMMFLMLASTGCGEFSLGQMEVAVYDGHTLKNVSFPTTQVGFKFPSVKYIIKCAPSDYCICPKKDYTTLSLHTLCLNIMHLLIRLLGHRSTSFNKLYIYLNKGNFQQHNLLGSTGIHSGKVIITLNLRLHSSLEEIAVTFLHELAHVLEDKLQSDHGLQFYSLYIGVYTLFLHYFDNRIPELDFEILKRVTLAAYFNQ